jgi:2-dehydropantoate 2-reductase
MKIAVIGAGAVGSIFTAQLAKAGHDITLIDKYPQRAALLCESGMNVTGARGEYHTPINAVTDAADLGPVDLVLVCVKAYDTQKAIEQHLALVNEQTAVMTLQNGLGNVEQICKVVDPKNVLGGTTAQGGYLTGDGALFHAGNGPTHIGEPSGQSTPRILEIATMFSNAGIETHVSDNVDVLIWTKLVINVGLNALTALLHVNNGLTAKLEPSRAVQKAAVAEALLVAKAAGIPLNAEEVAQKVIDVANVTFENVNSMLSDVMKKRRTEIAYINGAVCDKGAQHGIATPVNQTLTNLIRATETAYGKTI